MLWRCWVGNQTDSETGGAWGLGREFKRTVKESWMEEWLNTRKIFYTFVGRDFIPTGHNHSVGFKYRQWYPRVITYMLR
jgi:hypothetical protein